jgi:hypothetical protein
MHHSEEFLVAYAPLRRASLLIGNAARRTAK